MSEPVSVRLIEVEKVRLVGSGYSSRDVYVDDVVTLGEKTLLEVAISIAWNRNVRRLVTFKQLVGTCNIEVNGKPNELMIHSTEFGHISHYINGIVITKLEVEGKANRNSSAFVYLSTMRIHHCQSLVTFAHSNQTYPFFPEEGETIVTLPNNT